MRKEGFAVDDRELTGMIEELCHSKAKEFSLIGYQVAGEDIWKCVSSEYKQEMPPLYQLVNDILSLKSNKYMNWAMKEMYKS